MKPESESKQSFEMLMVSQIAEQQLQIEMLENTLNFALNRLEFLFEKLGIDIDARAEIMAYMTKRPIGAPFWPGDKE